jgi:hypothetical protein
MANLGHFITSNISSNDLSSSIFQEKVRLKQNKNPKTIAENKRQNNTDHGPRADQFVLRPAISFNPNRNGSI